MLTVNVLYSKVISVGYYYYFFYFSLLTRVIEDSFIYAHSQCERSFPPVLKKMYM